MTFQRILCSVWGLLILQVAIVSSGAIVQTHAEKEKEFITRHRVSNLNEVKIVLDALGYELHNLGQEIENNEQLADRVYNVEKIILGIAYNLLELECDKPTPTTFENCMQIRDSGLHNGSGVYEIQPKTGSSVKVYCDMELDGGGWTAIQRRGINEMPKADRENFTRDWTDYVYGFGNETDDHWIGLQNINLLTRDCSNELAIKLVHWNGTLEIFTYSQFNVSGNEDKYRIGIHGFKGIGNDSMAFHNGMQFTTYDVDNDDYIQNCAGNFKGGWWYSACLKSNLNGDYPNDDSNGVMEHLRGIVWDAARNTAYYSYKMSEMLIRPNC